jgi:hypothetical protein
VDVRLDDPPALDGFAGASDRLELMLASARRGEGGEALDRRALTEKSWADSLTNVSSRTVTISSDDSDPEWYLHRVSTARGFGTWSNAATTIVEAWPVVLRFLTAKR